MGFGRRGFLDTDIYIMNIVVGTMVILKIYKHGVKEKHYLLNVEGSHYLDNSINK
jgi:hypothetical protein